VRPRRDRRVPAMALTLGAIVLGGAAIGWLGPTHAPEAVAVAAPLPNEREAELKRRFDTAVALLQARRYEHAATALHRVLELAPQMPEAHVDMGFAMLGLHKPALARAAFDRATVLRPTQANAYYGLALASEAQGELDVALGAMRSYLHLARDEDEAHLRRARAALWEWETRLAERHAAAKP
jgi:tetratricopeptide (TPR) repeat protein